MIAEVVMETAILGMVNKRNEMVIGNDDRNGYVNNCSAEKCSEKNKDG
jgi:hypothetical protein